VAARTRRIAAIDRAGVPSLNERAIPGTSRFAIASPNAKTESENTATWSRKMSLNSVPKTYSAEW
jgi:hypothetical protein